MTTFIGDFQCKIDAKGRLSLPSALKKQMTTSVSESFVVKKDIFEPCLVLFPMDEWERQNELIRARINPYNREHNKFLREFHRGKAEVSLDSNNRLLIPKRLLELVDIEKNVVLAGLDGKIEIWATEKYENAELNLEDFASLAENIMGNSPLT